MALDFFQMLDAIHQEHPDIFALLSQPGMLDLAQQIINAEQSGQPLTQAQINAKLQNTDYFKTTTPDARAYDALRAVDPAAANQRAVLVQRQIADASANLGISLPSDGTMNSQGFQFFINAVRNNWSADEIKYQLLAQVKGLNAGMGGEVGNNAAQIKNLFNDYGVPLSDAQTMDYAMKLGQGAETTDGIKGYAIQAAQSLFPSLTTQLHQGYTVRQIADPYLQMLQQETGVDPTTVNLTDPKYMGFLNQVDPKTGQRTVMPLDSALAKIRTDPTYGYDTTGQARQAASQLTSQLASKFGMST
jgi:hypothetical protein